MGLKLYFDILSQPSRALYIFLKKCEIPFEPKIIRIKNLEHYSPEYEAINPFKKVPAIEHNGFTLTESVGILRYLCREYKLPDHWYPKDSKKQAKVDEYLEWQHLNTRLHCASYFLVKYVTPLIKGTAPKPDKVAACEARMVNCLDEIENIWLKDAPYLTGNEISIADIICACEVEQPRMIGFKALEGRPRLTAWMERVAKETSPHYDEAHALMRKLAAKTKQAGKSSL